MVLELTVNDVHRLAFAKFLMSHAQQQSKSASPLNASAVLSSQDAVELFLIIVAQKVNLDPNKINFMDFWERLESKDIRLPYKEAMRHLNDCRVMIKHKGAFPSASDVDRCVADAYSFLNEATGVVFNTSFENVSLLDFVPYESVREHIVSAEEYLENGKFADSIEQSALAFEYLLNEFNESRKGPRLKSPFDFSHIGSFDYGKRITGDAGRLSDYIDNVNKSFSSISGALKVIAMDIDFDAYAHFRQITPSVMWTMDGKPHCYWDDLSREVLSSSPVYAQWCCEFVLESSVNLADRAEPYDNSAELINEVRNQRAQKMHEELLKRYHASQQQQVNDC